MVTYKLSLSLSKVARSLLKAKTLLERLSHTAIRTENPKLNNILIQARISSFSQSVSRRDFTIYGILSFQPTIIKLRRPLYNATYSLLPYQRRI